MEGSVAACREGAVTYIRNGRECESYIVRSGKWVLTGTSKTDEFGNISWHLIDDFNRKPETQTECSHADARVVYSACGVDLITCECGYEGKR